jgi:HAE1 family hydrophobic/amphiphilic exporter-1
MTWARAFCATGLTARGGSGSRCLPNATVRTCFGGNGSGANCAKISAIRAEGVQTTSGSRGSTIGGGALIGTLIGTVWLYIVIPKGFFPIEDTGFINVVAEGPSDISFSAMTERTRQVMDILLKDPAVDYLNITTGVGGANSTSNFGRALVVLKPRNQREGVETVVRRLRVKANSLVGVAAYFQIMQNINVGSRVGKSMYQYTLQSSDTATLYKVGPDMMEKIAKIPGLRDVTGDL